MATLWTCGTAAGRIQCMSDPSPDRAFMTVWQRWAATGWLLMIVAGLAAYATHSEDFSPRRLAATLVAWRGPLACVYVLALVTRSLVLIPSTPLVMAGIVLFPGRPGWVWLLSLVGIGLSSLLLYYFAEHLGLDRHFRDRYPKQFERVARALRSRWGFWLLVAWAFFPAVPTDLACHVAGVVRMPIGRFLAAVLLGEAILCGICVALGEAWIR